MSKVNFIFSLIFIFLGSLHAQNKGATPLSSEKNQLSNSSTTHAVIIGISDYQSPNIPDLQFADKDAEAFASWLKSPAGGSVPPENIVLLTNKQATAGQFITALDVLIENSKEGDLAIIYFSGHGDVEKKTISQPGYLLCYDAPPQNYNAGGTFNLRDLQEVISTISIKNNARIVIITDACHAGKLSGNSISGTIATAKALSIQFANEVKIMSCQANEFSLEGPQWGGGRGAFSFHLIKGLTGLADKNGDGYVNLKELDQYLEDVVSTETAPQNQNPMTVGDRLFNLSRVNNKALNDLLAYQSTQKPTLGRTDSKGFANAILSGTDSVLYKAFEEALEKKMFLEPAGVCANDLFLQVLQKVQFKPLIDVMRRNLASALLDEAQQALNALLDNDPYEANNWSFNPGKYGQYSAYLQRSIELLGEKHYMHQTLLAKKLYFEAFNLAKNIGEHEKQPALRDSFKMAAKAKFLESISLQPEAAYPYQGIGNLYFAFGNIQTDSLVRWDSIAADLSPNWLAPYLEIAYKYGGDNLPESETWLMKAFALYPKSYSVLERLSWLKQWQGKADESIAISKEMIAIKPDLFNAYSTLAATLRRMKGAYLEAEQYCLKSLSIEPNQLWWAEDELLHIYINTRRAKLAVERCEKKFDKASSFDKEMLLPGLVAALVQCRAFDKAERYCSLYDSLQFGHGVNLSLKLEQGRMYLLQGNLGRAEDTLHAAFRIDPGICIFSAMLGDIKALQGKPKEAETFFKKGIACGYADDEALFRYGRFLLSQLRPVDAEVQFRGIGKILPKSYYYGYGMALLTASRGKQTEALDWLEKSLDNFWPDAESISNEPLFDKIKNTKRFKEMMKKNFEEEQ